MILAILMMQNVAVGADIEIVVRMVGTKRILANYTLCPYLMYIFQHDINYNIHIAL